MARRTKPIQKQVISPFRPTNARFQARLIDFDTDSATLEQQHEAFLRASMNAAKLNSEFHIRLIGFASKLGDAGHNQRLALKRMNAVVSFLQKIDQRTLSALRHFRIKEKVLPRVANAMTPQSSGPSRSTYLLAKFRQSRPRAITSPSRLCPFRFPADPDLRNGPLPAQAVSRSPKGLEAGSTSSS
jgi:hypothetical protein